MFSCSEDADKVGLGEHLVLKRAISVDVILATGDRDSSPCFQRIYPLVVICCGDD